MRRQERPTLDALIQESERNAAKALSQGWLLSESGDGCLWLERDDDLPRFVDDSMAHGYVLARAEMGDEVAQVALAVHFLDEPDARWED
jgi:hypothetical protein